MESIRHERIFPMGRGAGSGQKNDCLARIGKNLLSHALVGVALVVLPLGLPLPLARRIGAFLAIILLNTPRMRLAK